MNRRHTRPRPRRSSAGCGRRSPAWCCGRRSSSASPARPRPSSRSCSNTSRRRGSSGSASSPTRSSPTRRRRSCPATCPTRSKTERRDRVMAVQQPIAFAFNQGLVGRTLDVLIDAPVAGGREPLWLGRTYADAPDVDGVTYVRGAHLEPGRHRRLRDRRRRGLRPDRPAAGRHRRPDARKARPRPRKKPAVVAGHPRWHVSRSAAGDATPRRDRIEFARDS